VGTPAGSRAAVLRAAEGTATKARAKLAGSTSRQYSRRRQRRSRSKTAAEQRHSRDDPPLLPNRASPGTSRKAGRCRPLLDPSPWIGNIGSSAGKARDKFGSAPPAYVACPEAAGENAAEISRLARRNGLAAERSMSIPCPIVDPIRLRLGRRRFKRKDVGCHHALGASFSPAGSDGQPQTASMTSSATSTIGKTTTALNRSALR